ASAALRSPPCSNRTCAAKPRARMTCASRRRTSPPAPKRSATAQRTPPPATSVRSTPTPSPRAPPAKPLPPTPPAANRPPAPASVVLPDPRGLRVDGIRKWSSGWMPPLYQGTPFRSEGMPVLNLRPRTPRPQAVEDNRFRLLGELNAEHRSARPGELELDARI